MYGSSFLLTNPTSIDQSRWRTIRSLRNRPGTRISDSAIESNTNSSQNFNFALKFQPQAFAGLTLIAWGQTLYYHKSVGIKHLGSPSTKQKQQMESLDVDRSHHRPRSQLRHHGADPHPHTTGRHLQHHLIGIPALTHARDRIVVAWNGQ